MKRSRTFAGFIAQNFGIENVLFVALSGVVFGGVVCLFLKETAPRLRGAVEGGVPV